MDSMNNFMDQQKLKWTILLNALPDLQIIAIAKKRGFDTAGKSKAELIDQIVNIKP